LVPAGGDVAVGGGEAEGAGGGEERVEVEADGGAGELGDFVFDGPDVKTVEEPGRSSGMIPPRFPVMLLSND
jgi:hypothetical protein